MNGHPHGHRGAPACIGTGVEHAVERHTGDLAVCIATDASLHARGVAFGRGRHAFAACIHHAARAARFQRGQADQRL